MLDSQNGVAIRADRQIAVCSDGKWIDTNLEAHSIAADKNGNIWFTDTGNLYHIRKESLPGGIPEVIYESRDNIHPYEVEVDPEGAVWFTAYNPGRSQTDLQVGHIDRNTSGVDFFSQRPHIDNSRILFTANALLVWDGSSLYRSPFVFPSLSPIQDIHFEAVPANELPEVNTQTRREFFIKNTGDGTLKISAISSNSGVFRFQADQFTKGGTEFDFTLNKGRILSGDSLRVVVVYLPTEPGQHNGRIVVESNDRTNPTYTINLSGATLGSVGPRIALPAALHFDSVSVGQTRLSSLRVRNNGRGYLAIRSIASDNSAFKVSADTLFIPPLSSRFVDVVFAPVVGGENSGHFTVSSDDPVSPEVKVELVGTGVVVPEGPISLDSYLAEGDQGRRVIGNAVPGRVYTFQLNVAGAPEIQGWSATIEYDPTQVRYVSGSFRAGNFIPGLVALVDEDEGRVSMGGTVLGSDARNSGNGTLGTLNFEVQEGFRDSTHLVVREVSFHRTDGMEDKRAVWSVATITWESVAGPLRGDFDGNDKVDFDDFFLFADGFGTDNPLLDLNEDGIVGFDDFFLFADNFGIEDRAKLIALAQQYLGLPAALRLEQNYPNPFNASTTIRYSLGKPGLVQLEVFGLSGQRIRSLVKVWHEPGAYQISWDGEDEQGEEVSTGVYLARLRVDGMAQVHKLMLVK